MINIKLYYLLSLIFFCEIQFVVAQDAYKWTDKNGRVIYGNKAPKAGSDVKAITTRGLSKYNSNKVLKRMGTEISGKEVSSSANTIKDSKEEASIKNMGGASETQLETSEVIVLKDDEGRFTSVKVVVKNPSPKDALDVSVAFRFSDGNLVPAEGPFEIQAGGEGEYQIPKELLPIENNKSGNQEELPKAIAHGLNL